jgi:phage terminase large subunit
LTPLIQTPRAFVPLLSPSRYKGSYGGRGSGKSHFFGELLIEECLSRPGLRWVCIREVQKSLEQSVKRVLEDKITKLGVGAAFRVLETEIRTPGGGLIIFQGMQNHTADSIKSLEGYDGAWVEEAQSLSQRSLDLLRPTIRKPGSQIWFSWNPRRATDPVEGLFRGSEPYPDAVCVRANFTDNPWFKDTTLLDEMKWDRARDPDKYAHIWLGEYERNSEARVFKNWRVEEFDTPPDARFHHGADWGFAIDPTVLVRCYFVGRTLYVDREAYKVGCEIDRTPALFDALDPAKPKSAREWVMRADSARPETISYMRRNGYPRIEASLKGPNSVKDGIEFLKSYDIVVHPRCKHTIDELTLYSWKTDRLTNEVLPVLEDKKNHVIDALRYAVESIRRAAPSPQTGTFKIAR